MNKWMLVSGAVLGALAVASGAFGAHALQGVLSERARGWYDTAVTYHAGHALALFACGLLALHVDTMIDLSGSATTDNIGIAATASLQWLRIAAVAFLIGIGLFAGSLYLMAFTGWTKLGMITPLGGLSLIVGWLALALAAVRLPSGVS